jgi:dTDP-4-dehydrorhamnose reductase
MKNVLVTGSNGQLGNEFQNLAPTHSELNFFFKDINLDISDKKGLENFINNKKINMILNTAAYTNVNRAEIEKEKAYLINVLAVKNLVELSEKYQCKLIHFSTDYVYCGLDNKPIDENSRKIPINYYGITKRDGEIFIEESHSESIIIRTSWLYSSYGNNFVNTIFNKAKKESEIHVVNDQYGCPTHAKDLALDTINILTSKLKLDFNGKVYNYSNLGSTNWSSFAKKIIEYSKLECKVCEVPSSFFKSSVRRPKYSITSKNKIIETFNLDIPHWKDSLKNYLTQFKK